MNRRPRGRGYRWRRGHGQGSEHPNDDSDKNEHKSAVPRAKNEYFEKKRKCNEDPPKFQHEPYDRQLKDAERKFKKSAWLGFKKLEEWSEKNATDLLMEVLAKKKQFLEFVNSDKLTKDGIVVVLKIFTKLCVVPFAENRAEIINLVSRGTFLTTVNGFLVQLPLQSEYNKKENLYFWKHTDEFFANINIVCNSIIDTLPTTACEVLPNTIRAITVAKRSLIDDHNINICDSIIKRHEKLIEKLSVCKTEIERKATKIVKDAKEDDEEEPPNDFRLLTVYPTVNEILDDKEVFVRKNIVAGSYKSVNHYLDVQFRLLKEDFVAPLREGIKQYCTQAASRQHKKISNIKIYPNVTFLSPKLIKNEMGVLVQFNLPQKSTKNKKAQKPLILNAKRLMYGSLLCFTANNFNFMFFGKVSCRDEELLEKQQILASFTPGYDRYEFNKSYLMVECGIYFEPYYHVLKALQKINEDEFPMPEYIINVEQKTEMPTYLAKRTDHIYTINGTDVDLSFTCNWPNTRMLGLNHTQSVAYRAALTQKFVVIQGPPGTGKTYLGLKIVKTLLENVDISTPILIICYTNHALDQFLEGLIDATGKMVRIGGQSKNSRLAPFNLRMQKKTFHFYNNTSFAALREIERNVNSELNNVMDCSRKLETINKYEGVIDFVEFRNIYPQYNNSWFARVSKANVIEWLFQHEFESEQRMDTRENKSDIEIETTHELQQETLEEIDENIETLREYSRYLNQEWQEKHEVEELNTVEVLPMVTTKVNYLTSITQLTATVNRVDQALIELCNLNKDVQEHDEIFTKRWELEMELIKSKRNLEYLKFRLDEGKNNKLKGPPAQFDIANPNLMTTQDRWKLYYYWLDLYKQHLTDTLQTYQKRYRKTHKRYEEVKNIVDIEFMKTMKIVGMTTTSAARLQTSLQALRCKIVVVEEAAEILESHVVVSLTNHCEHFILIGDHQQLRPKPADYKLETKYNLGISLFERMVRNNIERYMLGVQHRMRPEIAQLIVPTIYLELENHPSVYNFPNISGVVHSLYFINHKYPETAAADESKLNMHEAKFLIRFARYLIQNGYRPEDVTIVAAYSGQMFVLWQQRKLYQDLLGDVRITVLDNYQGEESKIILLSLVRNNEDNQVGFLKIENRICVALSRAKEGFYMMGNMDLLSRNSSIWSKIKDTLESNNSIGDELSLTCRIHQVTTNVKVGDDFDNVPEGGCNRVCREFLNCGHRCTSICHLTDREHVLFKCKADCNNILCDNKHKCPDMCYKECQPCKVPMHKTLKCSHQHWMNCSQDLETFECPTLVSTQLPCGHTVDDKPCFENVATYRCPYPCDIRVEMCGHACKLRCHVNSDPDHLKYECRKPCARLRTGCTTEEHTCPNMCFEECPKCEVMVEKTRTICTHRSKIKCYMSIDDQECHKPCKRTLACGHNCKNKCSEPCINCIVMVEKEIPECGHKVKVACSTLPVRKNCNGKCVQLLKCGHRCQNLCKDECTKKCTKLVDNTKPADCGHKFQIACNMREMDLPSNSYSLLKYCREPCQTLLECTHWCLGSCGECVQGRIHKACAQKCENILICGHPCSTACRETCQTCKLRCTYRCKHSACNKECGQPCTSCKENCNRKCDHVRCKKRCGQICSVLPCTLPCSKRLKCGHPCIGFCGDPCPPLCKICNQEDVTELFFGNEDEPEARFVLLEECKHVIESEGMETWLQGSNGEINYKTCPKCKTPLSFTQRYSDYIKQALQDVFLVKKKLFGDYGENEKSRTFLLEKLDNLDSRDTRLQTESKLFLKTLLALKRAIIPIRHDRRQHVNQILARTLTSKLQIVEKIVDIFDKYVWTSKNITVKVVDYAEFLLRFVVNDVNRITNQEMSDFDAELLRFSRICLYLQNEQRAPCLVTSNLFKEVQTVLFSITKYTPELDASVQLKLQELIKLANSGLSITNEERLQILKAMNLGSGHWFKCPNGHIYAIGECGGAMEKSKCNECGAAIGGTNHLLLLNNSHSREMDGSAYPAYSEIANNLMNFDNLMM